ncbi:MAG: TIGR01777 family oxidoreductase [Thermodesulfobacteriota bacterium]
MPQFIFRSHLAANAEEAFSWHARPGAFLRLTPPWERVEVLHDPKNIHEGAVVVFRIIQGPVPVTWAARHTVYRPGRMFADEQIAGPFAKWRHEHFFSEQDGGCRLTDCITYTLPGAPLGPVLGAPLVVKKLCRMFFWRHTVTANDLALARRYPRARGLTVLVSGSSGLLGRDLASFLTTSGHKVIRLVRRPPVPGAGEAFWDPEKGVVDLAGCPPVDAVVHLAGENIGEGRLSPEKKRRVVSSRIAGTDLLARAAARLSPRPAVFISASAVGYYGHRQDDILSEEDGPGSGFVADLCRDWERASRPAADAGIRTANLRIGVVLTPAGGALARLYPPARMGLCPYMGHGGQFVSWISPDDVIGAIFHVIASPKVQGPVNLVAPEPATSRSLARTLVAALGRGVAAPVPRSLLRMAFGDLTDEVLLASARVIPNKLLQTGYKFLFPDLSKTYSHVLGLNGVRFLAGRA